MGRKQFNNLPFVELTINKHILNGIKDQSILVDSIIPTNDLCEACINGKQAR